MGIRRTYNIKVYVTKNKTSSVNFEEYFKIKLYFNDTWDKYGKHDLTVKSRNRMIRKISEKYNIPQDSLSIHYSSYFTDPESKLLYPRYVIITDENLYNIFYIKRRNETIDMIVD